MRKGLLVIVVVIMEDVEGALDLLAHVIIVNALIVEEGLHLGIVFTDGGEKEVCSADNIAVHGLRLQFDRAYDPFGGFGRHDRLVIIAMRICRDFEDILHSQNDVGQVNAQRFQHERRRTIGIFG